MSIPHFKSNHDWEAFTQIFDQQWHCKKALLDRVKDDMFPNTSWNGLTSKSIEVINDIVTNLLYDVDRKFKETHQDYKTEDDELFIPYRSFKENVAEALLEANQKFWNSGNLDCPPCDTLACADHLTDE
jgi:hypothetical protein